MKVRIGTELHSVLERELPEAGRKLFRPRHGSSPQQNRNDGRTCRQHHLDLNSRTVSVGSSSLRWPSASEAVSQDCPMTTTTTSQPSVCSGAAVPRTTSQPELRDESVA